MDESTTCASTGLRTVWRNSQANTRGVPRLVEKIDPQVRASVRILLSSYGSRKDRAEVLDFVQEVYCRLLERERRVLRRCRAESDGEVRAYLRRVARSVVVDSLRRRSAAKRGASLQVDGAQAHQELDLHRDSCPSPERRLAVKQLREAFRSHCYEASRHLPTAQRDSWIAERVLVDGWTSREVARHVRLSASSIDTLISRLRTRLEERGLQIPHRSTSRGRRRR